jgi:hypothetical protein
VNIRMISQGASEINISVVVKESDVPQAVRFLHKRFFTSDVALAAVAAVNGSGGGKRTRSGAKANGKPAIKPARRNQINSTL